MASRLSVYPVGRELKRRTSDLSQPVADDVARRPVARGKLDLRGLGWLHDGGLAVERKLTRGATPARKRLPKWASRILIFHFVCLSWIFFRAQSLAAAWEMLKGLGSWSWRPESPAAFLFLAMFSIPLLLVDLYLEWTGDEYCFASRGMQPGVAFGLACALIMALLGANQANAFIYFQF